MQIKCPECGFTREVPDSKVPASAKLATCPKCKSKFRFREETPEFVIEDEIRPATPKPPEAAPEVPPEEPPVEPPAGESEPVEPIQSVEPVEPKGADAGTQEAPEIEEIPVIGAADPDQPGKLDIAGPDEPFEEIISLDESEAEPPAAPKSFPGPLFAEPAPEEDKSPESRSEPDAEAENAPMGWETDSEPHGEAPPESPPGAPSEPEENEPLSSLFNRGGGQAAGPGDESASGLPGAGGGDESDIWRKLESMELPDEPRRESARTFKAFEPLDDEEPRVDVPWERLDQYGFFGGLYQTVKRAMFSPALFFSAMPVRRGFVRPLTFFLLIAVFYNLVAALWMSQIGPDMPAFQQNPELYELIAPTVSTDWIVVSLLATPLLALAFFILAVMVLHGFLFITRAANQGLEATWRVFAYASSTALLVIIPFFGLTLMPFWFLAILIIGLKNAHKSSYGQVLLALIIPVVLLVVAGAMFSAYLVQMA